MRASCNFFYNMKCALAAGSLTWPTWPS